jgi:hypothetical protein
MDPDQTARMGRLVWIHAGCKPILLVMLWRGSYVNVITILSHRNKYRKKQTNQVFTVDWQLPSPSPQHSTVLPELSPLLTLPHDIFCENSTADNAEDAPTLVSNGAWKFKKKKKIWICLWFKQNFSSCRKLIDILSNLFLEPSSTEQ